MATQVVVAQRMYQRRGTAAEWTAKNPILAAGEIGIELGTTAAAPQKIKVGNGVSPWSTLAYFSAGGGAWYTGSAVPASSLGNDGDMYLRTGTGTGSGDVYQKVSGTWTLVMNIRGAQGNPGVQGNPGPSGKSAYQVALDNGYGGTEAQWVASLKGEKGDRGETGPAGLPYDKRVQQVNNTDTGSVVCDWSAYDEIRIVLTTDTALTFVGALDAQNCSLKVRQNSVGGHALTLPAVVRLNDLIGAYTITQSGGRGDKLGFMYDESDGVYDFVAVVPGI